MSEFRDNLILFPGVSLTDEEGMGAQTRNANVGNNIQLRDLRDLRDTIYFVSEESAAIFAKAPYRELDNEDLTSTAESQTFPIEISKAQ